MLRLCEHRWQILRGGTGCDADAYTYSNGNGNGNGDTDADPNFDCNAERDTETYADAKGRTDAEAAFDSGATPIKTLASLDLQPLLYAWPKFANANLQIATEINVRSLLERHRPRAGDYLAQIFDRGK